MQRPTVLAGVLGALAAAAAGAAGPELARVIPGLFGPQGLIVDSDAPLPDGSTHSAHFNSAFQSAFGPFNVALGTQLATLPLPSPASSFTYEFDPSLGVVVRSREGLGPIFAERAETIGKGHWAFGMAYQTFGFDELEGLDLDQVPAVFTHDNPAPGGRADVVTTDSAIDLSVERTTVFVTYGLADRVDLSLAAPLVRTELEVESLATVRRLGTGANTAVHYFEDAQGERGASRLFASSGSAGGIGDLVLRAKGTVLRQPAAHLAVGLDVRLPTGDELDLLGTGAWGAKPFVVFSRPLGRLHPHLDLAYQWNGDSVLAGDVERGDEGDLPDQWLWAAGLEIRAASWLTFALDLLGQRIVDAPRLEQRSFTGLDAAGSSFADIAFTDGGSFSTTTAAVGAKVGLGERLLLDFAVLVRLDDAGLTDRLTPLLGVEASF